MSLRRFCAHGATTRLSAALLLGVVAALLPSVRLHAQAAIAADVLIRGGLVVDGTGAAPREADVALRGDRIVFIGDAAREGMTATRTINARGLVVAPGFIDPHTHTLGDLSHANAKQRQNVGYLAQGVTTVITGNDGGGPIDIGARLAQWTKDGIGTNGALLIGFGSLRQRVLGASDAPASPAQRDSMKAMVTRAMADGALGMSTGLYYAPQSFASPDEVIDVARALTSSGGIYDSHLRDESSYTVGLLSAVAEALRIGREAEIPVNISHIKALGVDVWGKSDSVIAMVRAAQSAGVRVTADQYPYTASGTGLGASLLPRWAEAGGRDSLRQRAADPATRAKLVVEMTENMRRRGGAASLLITGGSDRTITGKTLEEIATARKLSPIEAALAVILAGDASVASFNMNEKDIENFMRQDFVMTGSDGSGGHPRKFGTYPKKLKEYVYGKKTLSLADAVHRSSAMVADAFGIAGRGRLTNGAFADVIVFDPATVSDRSTYQQPELLATGMRWVFVNGKAAISEGTVIDIMPGRALRRAAPPARGQ